MLARLIDHGTLRAQTKRKTTAKRKTVNGLLLLGTAENIGSQVIGGGDRPTRYADIPAA